MTLIFEDIELSMTTLKDQTKVKMESDKMMWHIFFRKYTVQISIIFYLHFHSVFAKPHITHSISTQVWCMFRQVIKCPNGFRTSEPGTRMYIRKVLLLTMAQHTFPSSITNIRLQDRTVFSLCAIISMVQSAKASLIVVCTKASVSVSMAAVASSSIRIYNWQSHMNKSYIQL